MTRLQVSAVALLTVGYALLSHYSNASPNGRTLGAILSYAPVLLIGVFLAWRWASPLIAIALLLSIGALSFYFWPVLERNYELSDLVQQGAVYGLIALAFGRSLSRGQEPLCTQLAAKLHGSLTPEEVAYTRRATFAWTIFYALLAVTIVALFFLAPLRVWSLFVNFVVFGLIALMCVGDHLIRRKVLPGRPRGSLVTALRQSLIG